MKRKELIRKLEDAGCILIRNGGKHDWFQNINTKIVQPVPRHTEIKESLAKHILKLMTEK